MNILSVLELTELARILRIPHIPAKIFTVVEWDSIESENFIDLMYKHERGAPNTMLRFEYGATARLRYKCKNKNGWSKLDMRDLRGLEWDDRLARLYDTYKHRAGHTKGVVVVERPFVELALHRRKPIEYRCYVNDGEITGLCFKNDNKPLWDEQCFREMMFYTNRIKEHVGPDNKFFDYNSLRPNFTLDFSVDKDGRILLLDGGEPWHRRFNSSVTPFLSTPSFG